MLLFAYITFFFVFVKFFLDVRLYKSKFVFILPIYLLFFDILKEIFLELNISDGFNGLQAGVLSVFFLYYSFLSPKVYKLFPIITLFLIYLFFRVDYSLSFVNYTTRYIITFMVFALMPIAYNSTQSWHDYKKLLENMYTYIIVFIIYTIIASLLKFGRNMYNTNLIYGLAHDTINGPSFSLLLLPFLLKVKKNTKMVYLVVFVAFLLLVLTLKRTPIIIVFIGYSVYALYSKNRVQNFIYILIIGSIFLVGLQVVDSLNLQRSKYSIEIDVDKESRLSEHEFVLEHINNSKSSMILGTGELYNTRGQYLAGNEDRPLHTFYAELLHGGGILALSWYISIILYLFFLGFTLTTPKFNSMVKSLYIACIAILVVTSFVGPIRYIGYNGVLFIFIGSLLKVLRIEDFKGKIIY